MTLKNDTHVNVTISSNHCPMIYYLIDDGDYESIRFCQNNGCAIKTITFYGKPYYFALVPAKTQKQADSRYQENSREPEHASEQMF